MYVDRTEAVRTDGDWAGWLEFFITGVAQQVEESVDRTLALDRLRRRYQDEYGGI
jgi:Fic family protein